MISRFLVLALLITSVTSVHASCLKYEPRLSSIEGKLVRKTFAGPPNYESIKNGDQVETGFYVIPNRPLCTTADEDSEDSSLRNVRLVQVVLDEKGYEQLRPLLGKNVRLKGSLFGASTGHHHADLLLNFKSIAP